MSDRGVRGLLLAALAPLVAITAVPRVTRACGQCIEDKVAATYDAGVRARAARIGHVVVVTEVRGPAAGAPPALREFLLHVLSAIPGVDPGTVRVSLDPPAAAFACDPHRHPPATVLAAANPRLAGRGLSLAMLAGPATPAPMAAPHAPFNKQKVAFKSAGLTLAGYVFKPDGAGPFPTLIWNHGSEPNPGGVPQFDSVAAIFVPAGYAVMAPIRRGQSDSEGDYIQDRIEAEFRGSGPAAAEQLMVQLMESEQLGDQLAGLAYAKTLPFVDTTRLVVAGCSYGGIQTLLAAERGAGFKAAMAVSPAALSWNGHLVLQDRLREAVRHIGIPVLLIQPPKDASLEPARVLGAEAKRAGKASFTAKVYPATMPESQQGHCFGGAKGMRNWSSEALEFFGRALGMRPAR